MSRVLEILIMVVGLIMGVILMVISPVSSFYFAAGLWYVACGVLWLVPSLPFRLGFAIGLPGGFMRGFRDGYFGKED